MGQLYINNNTELTEISGFTQLNNAERIDLWGNDSLERISGFDQLNQVSNHLKIERNDELTHVTGFTALTQANELRVSENPELQSLEGFKELKQVDDRLHIERNNSLSRLTQAFESLESVRVMSIRNNQRLCGGEIYQIRTQLTGQARLEMSNNQGTYDACGTCGGSIDQLDLCADAARDTPRIYRSVDVAAFAQDCFSDTDFFSADYLGQWVAALVATPETTAEQLRCAQDLALANVGTCPTREDFDACFN